MNEFQATRVGGLLVRPLQPSDAEAYGALVRANAKHLHRFPFASDAPDLSYRISNIKRGAPFTTYQLGVFLADPNSIVGEIEVKLQPDDSYQLSVWLAECEMGNGYAYQSVNAVVVWLFANTVAPRIDVTIAKDNTRSIELFESLAFVNVGTGTRNDYVFSLSRYAFERV